MAAVSASEPPARSISGGVHTSPCSTRPIGLAQRLDAERLRNEAGSAEFHAAPDHGRIVVGRNHDDRQARILRAQIHQAGKAAHAGHAQIEQDQIDVAAALEEIHDLFESAGLADSDPVEQAVDRLAQRAAEQRMIVGDQQMMRIQPRSMQRPNRVAHGSRTMLPPLHRAASTAQPQRSEPG